MRMSRLAAAAAVASTTVLAPPATADTTGSVSLSIVGSRAGRGAIASCVAVAKPVTAVVSVECSSDIMVATGYGVGAASASVVGITHSLICGFALAEFTDGSVATSSSCRRF